MPVEQGNCRHRVRQQAVPEAIESLCEEARGRSRVLEIQAVGVEFGEGAGRDYYSRWVLCLQDVEGEVQGFDKRLGVC